MSRLTLRRKGTIRAAAISAAGLVGAIVPMSALAATPTLTINLQLAPGLAGASDTSTFLTPLNTAPIPVYVYATVTGSNAPSGSDFDGLQYAYYNINNSAPTLGTVYGSPATTVTAGSQIAGGATAANINSDTFGSVVGGFNGGLELSNTSPAGLTGNGVQAGALTNAALGASVGSSSAVTSIAKPRSANIVWNTSTPSVSTDTYTSGDSTSFLVETIMFTPTGGSSFAPSSRTPSSNPISANIVQTTLSASIPTAALAAADLVPANFWADSTSTSSPTGFQNSASQILAGTGVTFTNALQGDANGDGIVNGADLAEVTGHFNATGQTWATGDFNGDGIVNGADLAFVTSNFNFTQTSNPLAVVAQIQSLASEDNDLVAIDAALAANPTISAVPEPTSLALLAIGGAALLGRRRTVR